MPKITINYNGKNESFLYSKKDFSDTISFEAVPDNNLLENITGDYIPFYFSKKTGIVSYTIYSPAYFYICHLVIKEISKIENITFAYKIGNRSNIMYDQTEREIIKIENNIEPDLPVSPN